MAGLYAVVACCPLEERSIAVAGAVSRSLSSRVMSSATAAVSVIFADASVVAVTTGEGAACSSIAGGAITVALSAVSMAVTASSRSLRVRSSSVVSVSILLRAAFSSAGV